MHVRRIHAFLTCVVALGLIASTVLPQVAAAGGIRGVARSVGIDSFEPTLGATGNGDLYFSITPDTVVAGWKASIAKSTDEGRKWKDVGPGAAGQTMPIETNDPYIYVDPATDRVFTFHMSPILTCSVLSFSDDGGQTWTTNPAGCSPTGVWDHQTVVAAKPRSVATRGYPNVLIQCVNAIYAAMCSRSVDGGLVWEPSVPVYVNDKARELCGAQTGHLASAPDGTVYLPTSVCGTNPTVFITRDDGATWERQVISKMDIPFVDPSVSVDSKGNVYATWIDESGWLYYSVSRNGGKAWTAPVKVAQGVTAQMPVIVAGDPGKVVIAYPATDDLPQGFDTEGYAMGSTSEVARNAEWGANFSLSLTGLDQKPRFKTIVATGSDPIGRGAICGRATRCDYLVDFIEAVIGPDGAPYAAFIDGCTGKCATDPSSPNDDGTGTGLLTSLEGAPKLCSSVCWRYKAPGGGAETLMSILMPPTAEQLEQAQARTIDALPAELRALHREAAERRLDAVLSPGT